MTTPTPVAVAFNDPDEFVAELRRDRERIDRGILRVTVRRRYGSPFVTVSVVATATVEGVLVRLEHRVGEAFVGDEGAAGLAERTKAVVDTLTAAGATLGLDLRAWAFE